MFDGYVFLCFGEGCVEVLVVGVVEDCVCCFGVGCELFYYLVVGGFDVEYYGL